MGKISVKKSTFSSDSEPGTLKGPLLAFGTHALEITAPSLYSALGDKAGLFYKSIDYYLAHEACPIETIFVEAKTAKILTATFMKMTLFSLMIPSVILKVRA